MKRQGLLILAIVMFILSLITGFKLNNEENNAKSYGISYAAGNVGPAIGRKAPDFTLSDLSGQKTKLSEVIKNSKVTLVNFWATWCPPCREEIPELIDFYRKYNSQKVSLLGIDIQENPIEVKTFVQKNKMNYPVLTDTDGKTAQQYNIYAIPTTFFIDRNGMIKDKIEGGTDFKALEMKLKTLLKE